SLERLGMHLDPVLRRRARKMDGVELPGPGARGLEAKLGCLSCGCHDVSFNGLILAGETTMIPRGPGISKRRHRYRGTSVMNTLQSRLTAHRVLLTRGRARAGRAIE